MEFIVAAYDKLGHVAQPSGSRSIMAAPGDFYLSRDDKWTYISCPNDQLFGRLSAAIGKPELASDPRFATPEARMKNREEVEGEVANFIRSKPIKEIIALLDHHEVPAGPVYDIADIYQDPHYAAREDIIEVPDTVLGSVKMQGIVPKLSLTPGKATSTGPGQDNEQVYGELLGLSNDDLKRMQEQEVI